MRALAALAVVFYHAHFSAFSGGFVGVDVFFVISGYLISSIILREHAARTFSFATFYERRARRILPPLLLVCLMSLPWAWLLMTPGELEDLGAALIAVAAFVPNVLFWKSNAYFTGGPELSPLLHTWSLGVEEQFYFFFPIALLGLLAYARRWLGVVIATAAIGSLIACVWLVTISPLTAFYLLPTRAWELLAGVFVAVHESKLAKATLSRWLLEATTYVGLLAILIPNFLYTNQTLFPGLAAVPPVLGTALLVAFARQGTSLARFFSLGPVVGLGLVSYGLYLWHQPIFVFARMAGGAPSFSEYLGLTGLALVLSYLSWRWVERPIRNRNFLSQRQVFAMSAAGLVAIAGAGAALVLAHGAPGRLGDDFRPPSSEVATLREGCTHAVGRGVYRCTLGDPSAEISVALIGDSHAFALADELSRMLRERRQAGVLLHTDCHPVPGMVATNEEKGDRRTLHCAKAHAVVFEAIRSERLERAIVAIRWTLRLYPLGGGIDAPEFDDGEGAREVGTPFRENLAVSVDGQTTAELRDVSRQVKDFLGRVAHEVPIVVIYPVPEVGYDPVREILKARLAPGSAPPDLSTAADRYRERNAAVISLLDSIRIPRLSRVRPDRLLCDSLIPDRCAVAHAGTLYYYDNNHLSDAGAALVLRDALTQPLGSRGSTR